MGKICCFTGHREIYDSIEEIKNSLLKTVCDLVKEGFDEFRTGGAVGFDMLAADAVLEAKKQFPKIRHVIYVPCITQNKYYTTEQNKKYLMHINSADRILAVSENYHVGCMHKRNRALADGSDVCVAYLRKRNGGTAYTVKYAVSIGCEVKYL